MSNAGSVRTPWDAVFRLRRAGRIEDALSTIEREWGEDGRRSGVRTALRASLQGELARVARERNHREQAIVLVRNAIQQAPDYPDLHQLLGELELERGRSIEAKRSFERARALAPRYADPVLALALLGAEAGKLGEAVGDVESFAAEHPPEDREAFRRGLDSLRRGSWEEARPYLERAYRYQEERLVATRQEIAAHLDEERLGEALELARSLVQELPGSPDTHHTLGVAYLALDWLDDAEESFARAIRLNADYHEARIYLAWVLFARGESIRAEAELNGLLYAVPGHETAQRLVRGRGSRPMPVGTDQAAS